MGLRELFVESAFPTLKRGANERCAYQDIPYAAINKARCSFCCICGTTRRGGSCAKRTGFPCSVAPPGLWHLNAIFPRAASAPPRRASVADSPWAIIDGPSGAGGLPLRGRFCWPNCLPLHLSRVGNAGGRLLQSLGILCHRGVFPQPVKPCPFKTGLQ